MNKLAFIFLLHISYACAVEPTTLEDSKNKILFVVSNARFYGESDINTSNHFAEIVFAYHEFKTAGFEIDFVSPKGGPVPLGYIYSDSLLIEYLYNEGFMNKLKTTLTPAQVNAKDYQAIFYSGGGAAMFQTPFDQGIQQLAMDIYENQKGIVSAVCHGTAGIADLKKEDGTYLVNGRRINGFPDLFEDKAAAYFQEFPFSIEERITANGGLFKYSEEGWDGYLEVDGRLITGQDPTSSALVARAVIDALK